jgi:hypothetical protein
MSMTLRPVDRAGLELRHVCRLDPAGDENIAMSPTTFDARRDLDDVAEELVHLGIGAGDLRPAVAEAHGVGLLLEIGELAARHLVLVDFGGAGAGAESKGLY